MIERASPVELRKALELANLFVKVGINFVPVPVANDAEHRALMLKAIAKLDELEGAAAAPPEGKAPAGAATKNVKETP